MIRVLAIGLMLIFPDVFAADSVCYGTTSKGRLVGGVKLPSEGPNYRSYGSIPGLLGRTYVHSKVRDVVVGAYGMLQTDQPEKLFTYGETGFADGGPFKPHKTHQNGLSVDFMVPVLDKRGRSVFLPTSPFNRWGYDLEFDGAGRYEELQIDFEALGAHIVALHKAAKKHGIRIWRVLFAPDLQGRLYGASQGDYIRRHIEIPNKRSWVRHDDHYHVDFVVKCKAM